MDEAFSVKLNVFIITFFIFLIHDINPVGRKLNGSLQNTNGDSNANHAKRQSHANPFEQYMKHTRSYDYVTPHAGAVKLHKKAAKGQKSGSNTPAASVDTQIESPNVLTGGALPRYYQNLKKLRERQSSKFVSHGATAKAQASKNATSNQLLVNGTQNSNEESVNAANASSKSDSGGTTSSASQPSEEMPSFDEWKKQRLEEHEKTGQAVPASNNVNNRKKKPKMQIKTKSKKVKKNYASVDCGAKVLAKNGEAHHASHILNAFNDEYMLNPCNAKIWFVVELCEAIQAHTLEIANYELFSSMPKEFSVFTSERYPSREWTLLGHFHAKDERIMQEFALSHQIFAKFIKVELSSHYGSEHYCPLSIFQVYGTSMVEEIESIETAEATPDDDDDSLLDHDSATNKEHPNLFGSAKDAVLQIVKTAAKAFSGQQDHQYVINGSQEDDKRHVSDVSMALDDDHLNISNISKILYELNKTLGLVDYKGAPNMPSFNFLSRLSDILNSCSLCSTHLVKQPTSRTLIESSGSCKYLEAIIGPIKFNMLCSLFKVLCHTNEANEVSTNHIRSYSQDILSIFRAYFCSSRVGSQWLMCDLRHLPNQQFILVNKSTQEIATPSSSHNVSGVATNMSGLSTTIAPRTVAITVPSFGKQVTESSTNVVSAEDSHMTDSASSTISAGHDSDSSTSNGSQKSVISTQSISDLKPSSASTIAPSAVDSSASAVEQSNVQLSTSNTLDATGLDPSSEGPKQNNVSVEGTSSNAEGDQIVMSPVDNTTMSSQTTNGMASTAGQKESVFMRLSNKIKSLELNLSLSSQYLQELSKRYRKQMDEMADMQHRFNKSMAALNSTLHAALNQNDVMHSKLELMESRLANLTEAYVALVIDKENMTSTLLEWHVVVVVIELVAMVAIFVTCIRHATTKVIRRQSTSPADHNHKANVQGQVENNLQALCGSSQNNVHIINKKKKNKKRHHRSQSTDLKHTVVDEAPSAMSRHRISIDNGHVGHKPVNGHHQPLYSSKHSPAGVLFNSAKNCRNEQPYATSNGHYSNKSVPLYNVNNIEAIPARNNANHFQRKKLLKGAN